VNIYNLKLLTYKIVLFYLDDEEERHQIIKYHIWEVWNSDLLAFFPPKVLIKGIVLA